MIPSNRPSKKSASVFGVQLGGFRLSVSASQPRLGSAIVTNTLQLQRLRQKTRSDTAAGARKVQPERPQRGAHPTGRPKTRFQ